MRAALLFRVRRGQGRRDSGTSLVELAVVMLVFSLVIGLVATLYIGTLRTVSQTQARVDETVDGRIGVSAMSRALRTAILPSQLNDTASTEESAFIEAKGDSLAFYANLDHTGRCTTSAGTTQAGLTAPVRMTYSIVNGELIETREPPRPWTCGTPQYLYCPETAHCETSKVLARDVVPGQLFTYYDALGTVMPLDQDGRLDQARLEDVDSVDVALTVRSARSSSDGSTYVLRVALPNHDAVIRVQEQEG
jgi:hypothetical protein